MTFFYQFLFLVATYLISAIPFGLVLTKIFANKDVREFGSKNIGATNVTRVAGKKLGFITLILDGLKGAIMVIIARFTFFDTHYLHFYLILVGFVAVVAHVYPVYLDFKGGKGVATTIAVLFALDFSVGFLVTCFWIMFFSLFRVSAVASMLAIFSSILLSITYKAPPEQIVFCVALLILSIVRHRENIERMLLGKENKL